MNRKQRKELKLITGEQFKRAMLAGIGTVLARQDYLNKINVFPVPDSDTGTNMAITLSTIAEKISHKSFKTFSDLLADIADSALQGARGNSGAILAQFFQGLSQASKDEKHLTIFNFPLLILQGASAAKTALATPREGTILSVIHAFASALDQNKNKHNALWPLFIIALKAAEHALKETPKQLEILRKAGVVDAGGQGFVDFLHGIKTFIETDKLPELKFKDTDDESKEPDYIELNTKFRYCTECLIINEKNNIDLAILRKELARFGDSLIVAGSAAKTKIHIHSNEPDKLFEYCQKYGILQNQKADDMIHQQKLHKKHPHVAILTDSGADIPKDLIDSLNIHIVPLSVQFGDETFIDKISMNSKQFYQKLKTSSHHPKTSQPPAAEFNRLYHYLNSHYDGGVLAMHMSGKISGTLAASRLAAKQITDPTPQVLDTLNCCGGQGLLVTYAAQMAKDGHNIDEIVKTIKRLTPKTTLIAAFPSLKFGVRGGRVSRQKKWLSDFLRLSPVVGMNAEGEIKMQGILKGKKNLDKKLAQYVFARYSKHQRYRICVVHADAAANGQQLLSRLLSHYHKVEASYMVNCGAVIGTHSGPDCLAVAMQALD